MVPEVADLVVDPLTGSLNEMLAGLADGVAECSDLEDAGEVLDAVRIDRIARLEKLKAAAAALQAAESVGLPNRRPARSWPPMSIRTRSAGG